MADEADHGMEVLEDGEEKASTVADPIQVVDVGWTESMLSKLQNMRQAGSLCDVMLVSVLTGFSNAIICSN